MSQPRLNAGTRALLDHHGLSASLYQPTYLFHKNGRKLPNAPEPSDPWECFLRRSSGEVGVVCKGIGATPEDAVLVAVYNRPGLKPAMLRLERAVEQLTEALDACQG